MEALILSDKLKRGWGCSYLKRSGTAKGVNKNKGVTWKISVAVIVEMMAALCIMMIYIIYYHFATSIAYMSLIKAATR